MKTAFREALIEHAAEDRTKVSDLVKGSGVSRSKIDKLLRRENDRVEVEDAIALAGYYGKTVEEFIFGAARSPQAALAGLSSLLRDDEAELLLSQIKGVVGARGQTRTSPAKS